MQISTCIIKDYWILTFPFEFLFDFYCLMVEMNFIHCEIIDVLL